MHLEYFYDNWMADLGSISMNANSNVLANALAKALNI